MQTWEQTSLAESRDGVDVDPNAPEFQIFIDPTTDYVDQLWWDDTPLVFTPGEVPLDETDGFSVVMHEILHGMGFVGWRDPIDGPLPGNYQSVWDSLVSVDGGLGWFTGRATTALIGRPTEVRFGIIEGATHLGAVPTEQPFLEASIMNSYYFFLGERYLPGRLELSMLADMGWTLRPSDLYYVVDPFNDFRTGVYAVGYARDDEIAGSETTDRLEGRGGNDTLLGGGGADRLDGGPGADRLAGGSGDDVYVRDHVGDVIVEAAGGGTDLVLSRIDYRLSAYVEQAEALGKARIALAGNALDNVLTGGGGPNVLRGGAGDDRLFGRTGADRLAGGEGSDVLAGGADGAVDRFIFASALGPDNVDRILQFRPADDLVLLSDAVFTALGAPGALAVNAWHEGASATSAAHRIVYHAGSGRLWYDADGSGAGEAVLSARFDAGTALDASDFWIV